MSRAADPGVSFNFPLKGKRPFTFEGEPLIKWVESHLYVVEFGKHGVKVGITTKPGDRLPAHERDGRNFGRAATRGWLSPPHKEARANEDELVAFCTRITKTRRWNRSEYSAAPFERVVGHALTLSMTRGEPREPDPNFGPDFMEMLRQSAAKAKPVPEPVCAVPTSAEGHLKLSNRLQAEALLRYLDEHPEEVR